jgi:hypothetical protein
VDESATILEVVRSDGPIPKSQVLAWMNDRDLRTRGAVYYLTDEVWDRITPALSMSEQCLFMENYLLDCLILDPESADYVHGGFQAAWELAAWLKHLEPLEGGHDVIERVVSHLTAAYLVADDLTRNRIETGAVEHILESQPLRRFFASWVGHPVLDEPYKQCLEWAEAHENAPWNDETAP